MGAPTRPFMRAAVLLIAVVLLGCQQRGRGAFTLGAAGPWKEGYGLMNRQGIELAVEQINVRGIDGRQLKVIYRDDDGDGAVATGIAQEFVDNAAVSAVIGHVNSGAMVSAAKIYDGDLVAVATTATSPSLTGISPWVFRVISSDSVNGIDIARFARQLGAERAAILYENDAYGRGLVDAFRRAYDGRVVALDPISSDGAQDLEPIIAWYKHLQADLVFVAGTEASGLAVLREARRQHFATAFLGGDGWTGVVADTSLSSGAYVGTPFSTEDPRPEVRRFVSEFEKRFKRTPDANAALAYDATMLLAQAISKVGPDRKRLRAYLHSLDDRRPFIGLTGPIRFLPSGDPVGKSFVMTRIRGGRLIVERRS